MTEEEAKKVIRNNDLSSKNKKRKCLVDNCNSKTISSHLL